MKAKITGGILALLAVLTLAGCGGSYGSGDAKTTTHPDVTKIVTSDGYSDLETYCDHGNRIYHVYNDDRISTVAHDPSCSTS